MNVTPLPSSTSPIAFSPRVRRGEAGVIAQYLLGLTQPAFAR